MPSNLMFPMIHHNMFLRKTKSAPILKPSSTFNKENDRLNRNIIYLQTIVPFMVAFFVHFLSIFQFHFFKKMKTKMSPEMKQKTRFSEKWPREPFFSILSFFMPFFANFSSSFFEIISKSDFAINSK